MEHKSERMMQAALANEWKAQVKTEIPENGNVKEIVWILYALRNKESLKVVWLGNRYLEATYSYGEHRSNPFCASFVYKIIEGKPNLRKFSNLAEELIEEKTVPFDETTPALQILLAVLGKEITWVRKIDGEILNGVVEKDTNLGKSYFRVYAASSGRRMLEWQDREGFHTVGLDQIVDVA